MSRVKKSRGSKFLALVVALTFLLSMAAPAFASAPAELQQSEAARLQTLGIIAGFPDGSLGLDQTMTRAQFAKVITIATGNEIIADAMQNSPTKFPDAKVGVWYTGYVNVASELGYILGYPDGTFKPNEPINNAEVLTILLRALGYDDRLPGSWPTDYLVKANELGISDDVTFAAKEPALRGDAFIFTSRTLDEEMVGWNSDISDFEGKDITLLAKAFKGTTDEGVLVDLNWDDEALMATLAAVDDDEVVTAEYEVVSTPVISGADGILNLLAKKVSYVLNSDDQVIYLGVQETKTVTDDAITLNDSTAEIDDKTYDLISGYELRAFPGEVPEVSDGVYAADKVTAVLDGGDIMAVLFEEYLAPGIVDEVDDEYITVLGAAGDVDLEDEDYAVIKDSALASLDDLEAGDLIYVVADAHGLDYLIVAVSKDNAITGTLEKANADFSKITVDGTEYDVDSDAIASSDGGDEYATWPTNDASDFVGEEVAILLSPAGKVAAITSGFEAEAGLYGILVDVGLANLGEFQVKILTAAGDEAVFEVDEDEVTNDTAEPLKYKLVEYSLNSKGEIDSITAIESDNVKVQDTDEDNDRIKLNDSWYRVTDTTAFFVYEDEEEENWQTVSWNTFADIDLDVASDVYVDYVADGNTLSALRYPAVVKAIGDYGVILGSGYNKGGAYYELMVLGDRVIYNLASGELDENVVGLVYGFTLNADNEIKLDDDAKTTDISGTVEAFRAGDYIAVNGVYYDLDAETSIVDVTDQANPEIKSSVRRGDDVVLYIDDDGFVDYILIVNNDVLNDYYTNNTNN